MLTALTILGLLAIVVLVLVGELHDGLQDYQRVRAARRQAALEQLRAEQQLHQLTQDAVQQMLEAVRGR